MLKLKENQKDVAEKEIEILNKLKIHTETTIKNYSQVKLQIIEEYAGKKEQKE